MPAHVLTLFLVWVGRVALQIVQNLRAHRDVQNWLECQRNSRDPDDRSRLMVGMVALLPAQVYPSGGSGADPVRPLTDPTLIQ